jgi:transcriptional regulator with XRE-family HTH domain
MLPGLRLRQIRERLGLTYRDVERISYELAARRGRPEFVLHLSRLADIENRDTVPSLHKLYTLSVAYHLNPLELLSWYDVPVEECFEDGVHFPSPQTHQIASPAALKTPLRFDPAFDPRRTDFLSRMVERWGHFEGALTNGKDRNCYGFVGLEDRRMVPLLRPGSVVLIDTAVRQLEDDCWASEHDRPMYFVDVRNGYRCGWFQRDGSMLVMQPHTLSRCLQESWKMPQQAEIVGRVVGVAMRFNEPWQFRFAESQGVREGSNKKAL